MSLENLSGLTAVEVAKLLGVTDRAVRKWCTTKGLPSNPGDGVKTFDWAAVLAWHDDCVRNEGGTGGTAVKNAPVEPDLDAAESYEDALARKTRAEANLKELQLAKERGQVASIADVERVLSAANKSAQTQLLAVPSRLATQMLGLDDHGQAVAILETEVRQILTNLASIDAVREAAGVDAEGDE